MNLRLQEVLGFLLFVAFLCSFGLPRSVSGRVENSFQFVFAPVTGPIQWMTSDAAARDVRDEPILTAISDDRERLRAEKRELLAYVETLRGQIDTLARRDAEARRVGERLRERVVPVKVIGVDGGGRDVLRLAGTTATAVERDQPVIVEAGLVGRVLDVGAGNQSSVRLVTDRGFKLVGRFARYVATEAGGVELAYLDVKPSVLEGMGNGVLRVNALRSGDVARSGLGVNDVVVLSDEATAAWPIEVHGYRIGLVSSVGESIETPGVAEVRVRPAADLLTLDTVMIVSGAPRAQ